MVYCLPRLNDCLKEAVMGITQRKGDLAVAQAIATFTRLGFLVFLPITESAPYDIIVDNGALLKRVQVKYTSQDAVDLRRIHTNSKGYVFKRYAPNAFDWLYVLRQDGREYLIKEFLSLGSVVPLEEERIERWQEPSPRGTVPSNGGENHGRAKLTNEQIMEIRRLADEGIALRELARQYGVMHSTIQAIVRRKTWTHI
jgi:hypothetical protein